MQSKAPSIQGANQLLGIQTILDMQMIQPCGYHLSLVWTEGFYKQVILSWCPWSWFNNSDIQMRVYICKYIYIYIDICACTLYSMLTLYIYIYILINIYIYIYYNVYICAKIHGTKWGKEHLSVTRFANRFLHHAFAQNICTGVDTFTYFSG